MTWQFTPGERRLRIALPPALGGAVADLSIHGHYTLAVAPAPVAVS